MLKTLSLSAALAALMATGALAQDTTTPAQPATPPAATAPAPETGTATATTTTTKTDSVSFKSSMAQNEVLASKLKGMEVRNSAGENLGDINDVVMDETGKATVAIVGVGGFLGLGEKNVGVPFSALAFADANDGKRVARLDVNKDALTAAPAFVFKDSSTAGTNGTASKPVASQ